jgi:thioredoxin reductase (NADPH)
MSDYLIRGIEAAPNVDVRTGTAVVGGGGDGRLQQLVLRESRTGEQQTVAADALFVLIGAHPRTDWLPPEIARGPSGFLLTGEELPDGCNWPLQRRPYSLETSMPGVLAAGDVRHSSVKRVASAVGEGSIAIQLVQTVLAKVQPGAVRPPEAATPGAKDGQDDSARAARRSREALSRSGVVHRARR